MVGLIAVAIACVTSGFSGVYFEMVNRKAGAANLLNHHKGTQIVQRVAVGEKRANVALIGSVGAVVCLVDGWSKGARQIVFFVLVCF